MESANGEEATQNGSEEKIVVSVRVRPLNEKEVTRNDVIDWECINDNTVLYKNSFGPDRSLYPTSYTFDRVFGSNCTTRQVYEEGAKAVALSVVGGINSSVFAYGQTSSGKTYTMTGITQYTMADIFEYIQKHKEREFLLKFSAMEIYNESVRDLLSLDTTPLRLLDDPERGTVVEKLTEETVHDWNHLKGLLSICEAQRQIGETFLNESSSRSHQIIRLTIESSVRDFSNKDRPSTLAATVNFIDLAGSERASQALSAGSRLKEGSHINRSLLTLGTVIRKLSKGRNGHVPYRDSKLTRILQSSLAGNARTAIICTMSPARTYVEQSRNTLLFACCAKEVTTNARVNLVISDKALVKQLQRELARLEDELRNAGSSARSDSASLLREKDLQIELLERQVRELTLQRDIALSKIQDLHLEVENERNTKVWESSHPSYPKLLVRRESWGSQTSHTPTVADLQSNDANSRTIETSHSSARLSQSSCDENHPPFDFEEGPSPSTVVQRMSFETSCDASSALLYETPNSVKNDTYYVSHGTEDQMEESIEEFCREVQCIETKELVMSNDMEPNLVSPEEVREALSLGVPENAETLNEEPGFSAPRHNRELSHVYEDFHNSCEISPSWNQKDEENESEKLSFTEVKTTEPVILCSSPSSEPEHVEKDETKHEKKHSSKSDKDVVGKLQDIQMKIRKLRNDTKNEILPQETPICLPAIHADERDTPEAEVFTKGVILSKQIITAASEDTENEPSDKELADKLEEESMEKIEKFTKNVKDVGLDPQDDLDTADWPSDFRRVQREIVHLWSVCNVSLIYRTYFFLLFKGDPADSIYMEVEHRRLSFIRDAFSSGNETILDGQVISLSLSKRHLSQERQMLSKLLHKRLTKQDRQTLYVKWGIRLESKRRSSQLAQRLWTQTEEMDHIEESSDLVAKLSRFNKKQVRKEMFGLNLMPNPNRSRSYSWRRSPTALI
ncbi:hypothetical protein V2J09_009524 [Rumex salicifolius]